MSRFLCTAGREHSNTPGLELLGISLVSGQRPERSVWALCSPRWKPSLQRGSLVIDRGAHVGAAADTDVVDRCPSFDGLRDSLGHWYQLDRATVFAGVEASRSAHSQRRECRDLDATAPGHLWL